MPMKHFKTTSNPLKQIYSYFSRSADSSSVIKAVQVCIPLFFIIQFLFYCNPIYSQSAKSLTKTGISQLKLNQNEAAVQTFTEAIILNSKYEKAYAQRAIAYENLKKYQESANDYRTASELNLKNAVHPFNAGRILFSMHRFEESLYILNRSLKLDKNNLEAYSLKVGCLLGLNNYKEALFVSQQALEIKKTAQNYFNHGFVSEKLLNHHVAEKDYLASIKKDKKYKESYLGMARVLNHQGKSGEALSYCDWVILQYPKYVDAYVHRGKIYYGKSDVINATANISKAIGIVSDVDTLYTLRAKYYEDLKQYHNAIADYTTAIALDSTKHLYYFNRAGLYEIEKKITEATLDYRKFLELTSGLNDIIDMRNKVKQKIYDLNIETVKPVISITSPAVKPGSVIEASLNSKSISITAKIEDQSTFEYIEVNDKNVLFDKEKNSVTVSQEISITDLDKITITASDIYHNKQTVFYKLVRTEVDPPLIDILVPYASAYHEIFLETEDSTVLIQGKISDESYIVSIYVDGEMAKFLNSQKNPDFESSVYIHGKEVIKVKAEDIYGNITETTYKLNRESAKILANNPMGKTWVIFIDNSDYSFFASLEGPSKDVSTMRNAFSKYDIHNIIEKKNMTKVQLERFFSIELRDLVKAQNVNSLLVWYAGHGKFVNETGYWIPVDAKRDEEFTYFNVNSLKAFMQSYTKYVTHVLVVSDACETGPSFYAAMRGAKKRDCGDNSPTKFRSSQVFSSAGYELAADNSPFTKTFAKSLNYNTNECIAIDNIVISVTESVSQSGKQSPKFGKIQGLEDEDGTFFFIKKTK